MAIWTFDYPVKYDIPIGKSNIYKSIWMSKKPNLNLRIFLGNYSNAQK